MSTFDSRERLSGLFCLETASTCSSGCPGAHRDLPASVSASASLLAGAEAVCHHTGQKGTLGKKLRVYVWN